MRITSFVVASLFVITGCSDQNSIMDENATTTAGTTISIAAGPAGGSGISEAFDLERYSLASQNVVVGVIRAIKDAPGLRWRVLPSSEYEYISPRMLLTVEVTQEVGGTLAQKSVGVLTFIPGCPEVVGLGHGSVGDACTDENEVIADVNLGSRVVLFLRNGSEGMQVLYALPIINGEVTVPYAGNKSIRLSLAELVDKIQGYLN